MFTGLEVLLKSKLSLLQGKRIGLLVNQASIVSTFEHAADLFLENPNIKLTALFGPQHGIKGETQDNMIEWEGYIDTKTSLPVYSLYGRTRMPTKDMFSNLDSIVFDIQDIGTRVYTFIYTMANTMIACKKFDKGIIVLDRPNPINGTDVEGNVLNKRFKSFVGMYPIPMRHGMTIGELALLFNNEYKINCKLQVVKMQGWRRGMWFEDTELPWVMPSPNMPTVDTAAVYPASVLFEGTTISEGRGTTRPFELIGAPWIEAQEWCKKLRKENLPGVVFRPTYFQPTFQKWASQMCGGIQIHIVDKKKFRPYITGIALLKTAYKMSEDGRQISEVRSRKSAGCPKTIKMPVACKQSLHYSELRSNATLIQSPESRVQSLRSEAGSRKSEVQGIWRLPPYEYEFKKLPIDILLGDDKLRHQIEKNISLKEIAKSWQKDLEIFFKIRRTYLLYD